MAALPVSWLPLFADASAEAEPAASNPWLIVLLVAAACGGTKPPPAPPPPPSEKKVTRIPIETNEDEPEDGITFTNKKGTISKDKIDAGLAPHQHAMMDCYTAKVGKRRFLGGDVRLMWELKADGAIKSVKLDSNLGAWDIEQCLLDGTRRHPLARRRLDRFGLDRLRLDRPLGRLAVARPARAEPPRPLAAGARG